MNRKRSKFATVALIVLIAAVALGRWYLGERSDGGPAVAPELASSPAVAAAIDDAAIADAFRNQRSGVMVEAAGVVERTLSDDNEGSRHQRFIVRLPYGGTVLISHNIDLAPRVPLEEDDRVHFRGQYEWNDRGGVVHWTHHDPQGRHDEGWIRHQGSIYE